MNRLNPRLRLIVPVAALVALMLAVAACASGEQEARTPTAESLAIALDAAEGPAATTPVSELALAFDEAEVTLAPLPLRAGSTFTVTALIANRSGVAAQDVPVVVHISALEDEFGYQPFLRVLTVTVPASTSVPITVPVRWNLAAGEHRLWLQANRLPDAWQDRLTTQPEVDAADNVVLMDLWIEPFEAPPSTLCAGRVDLEIEPEDILPEPDAERVQVTIHNLGNRAVYNVPVVVFSRQASGVGYSPAIPACGGTARVAVDLEGNLVAGDSLSVRINPEEWSSGVEEDNLDNNQVAVSAGFAPGVSPSVPQLADYDFWIDGAGIELAQPGVLVITVQNRGTRDADGVPVQVENEAGRKVVDRIPLVRGQGVGVGAVRIAALGTRAGKLIVTINPAGAENGYPEANRQDNVATFQLAE